jgi:hypothetical protein
VRISRTEVVAEYAIGPMHPKTVMLAKASTHGRFGWRHGWTWAQPIGLALLLSLRRVTDMVSGRGAS